MLRLLVVAFLAVPLVTATPAGAAPPERALVAVLDPPAGTAARLVSDGLMVVRDLGDYLLVVADAGEVARIEALGLRPALLDRSVDGETYYTVAAPGGLLGDAGPGVRVLRAGPHDAVIAAAPEAAEALAARGFEIARVFLRPIRIAPEAKPDRLAKTLVADPLIQAIVDSVSGARVNAHVQRLQDFRTRYSTTDSCQAAANYIKAEFESYGLDSVTFHTWSPTYKPNVVAVKPGLGDPSKIVVIGGHYDSITGDINNAPGADDDASGTACVLECARVLAGHDFDYTIVFIGFNAEEQGLYGSEAYASEAAARGDDIVGMIQVDMIGYLAGGDAMDLDIIDNSSSVWMRDLAMSVGTDYVPNLPVVDGSLPSGASSDHASFWAAGYDAILFFEDTGSYSPYIHTTNDVVGTSYNSPTLAERSVKVAAGLVATIAEPFRIAIRHTPLANTTDTQNPYRVVAEILAANPLNPDSLLVHYTTQAGSYTLTMTPTGNPNEYEAFIPAQPGGTFVEYYLVAEDAIGNRDLDPKTAPAEVHTFFVGLITTVLSDDFEAESGWTIGAPGDNATTGIWVRVDPNGTYSGSTPVQPEDDHTPDPGVRCFVTGNAPPGSAQGTADVDGGKTTVTSPVYDLTSYPNARVRYHRWYTNDTGSAPNADTLRIDVSSDGGTTWARLETVPGSDRTWRFVEKDIEAFVPLTAQIRFRFIAADEGAGSIVEAGLDDFSIVTYEELATDVAGGAGAAARPALWQNIPNPFNPRTTIRYSVPSPGPVRLAVHDASGREVAVLVRGHRAAGSYTILWDGRDAGGRDAASGVYFLRMEAGSFVGTRKMVLVR